MYLIYLSDLERGYVAYLIHLVLYQFDRKKGRVMIYVWMWFEDVEEDIVYLILYIWMWFKNILCIWYAQYTLLWVIEKERKKEHILYIWYIWFCANNRKRNKKRVIVCLNVIWRCGRRNMGCVFDILDFVQIIEKEKLWYDWCLNVIWRRNIDLFEFIFDKERMNYYNIVRLNI